MRSDRRNGTARMAGLALGIVAFGASASGAELSGPQRLQTLLEAQQAFDRGAELRRTHPAESSDAFRRALQKFRLVIDSGLINGRLFYNLANAHLQLGELGPAILNYRRAERLIPGDGAVEANLRYARDLRRNRIADSGGAALLRTLFFWHYGISLRTRLMLAALLYGAVWTLMLLRLFVGRLRWGLAIVPVAALCATLMISVAYEMNRSARTREGVVMVNDVTARKGNGDGFEPQFNEKLNEGVEFRLREHRGDWLNIELPDGKTGWIRAREAELI